MLTVDNARDRLTVSLLDDDLLICLLGSFRLLRHGKPLDALIVGKAMMLLSTLALHLEMGVSREALQELLWPEQPSEHSAISLHSLIYSLHRRLRGASPDAAAVVFANGSYALNTAAGVSTDIAHFDALVAQGNRSAARRDDADAADLFERALAIYRGDLATGTDIHAVIERERLRASMLTILAWLADQAYRHADYGAALEHALRLLAFDPCREDAHRVAMRAHLLRGERAQALRQYRVCGDVLQREFDAAPEAATTALFELIRSDPSRV